ncbi:MAG: DUF1573 domain-containing protein [bacterium]
MNKTLIFFLLLYLLACDRSAKKLDYTSINFDKVSHDFGKIKYKKDVQFSFEFKNTGKTPLIISEVTTSCGCTVPQWTKQPVPPGKNGEIQINYDTSYPGIFSKTITVFYNGEDSPKVLAIKGSVKYPE